MAKQVDDGIVQLMKQLMKLMVTALEGADDGGQKATLCMTCATIPIGGLAATLMGDGFDPTRGKLPGNDHLLLSSLIFCAGTEFESPDGIGEVNFSPVTVLIALDHFKRLTGKDGSSLISPILMKIIKEATTVNADDFGPNSKFLPN